ncbi:hypothetical protein GA0115255_108042 [Streptomyces sp. Ncost-T6T-2b]|nr:hypothetical protein GA0115255_108042 [Streptomyces sp. Ncost-T6T-2b]
MPNAWGCRRKQLVRWLNGPKKFHKVPTHLPIQIETATGRALFGAYDVTRVLRDWADFFESHPDVSPGTGLREAADQIDLDILRVQDEWARGNE